MTLPEAVKNKGLTFHRVHRWFKGLYRWTAMYIVYVSITSIMTLDSDQLIPAAVLLAAFVIYPIV